MRRLSKLLSHLDLFSFNGVRWMEGSVLEDCCCSFVLCHGGSWNLRAPSILTKNSENVETGLTLLVQKFPGISFQINGRS